MLHTESRQGGKKDYHKITAKATIAFSLLLITACSSNQQGFLSSEELKEIRLEKLYEENMEASRAALDSIIAPSINDTTLTDYQAAQYYAKRGQWLWMGSPTQTERADTMVSIVRAQTDSMGFNPEYFLLNEITPLLTKMHEPDSVDNLPQTMAQLEYGLTKCYIRYARGQRFGFTDPKVLFGRNSYDTDTEQPDSSFYEQILRPDTDASALAALLNSMEPQRKEYRQLKEQLAKDSTDNDRQRTLCNMERLRWRNKKQPAEGDRYIFVNVAAQELWAINQDSVNNMRICCGKSATKSPLLTSEINKIDVNPEWGIPQSIIRNEMSGRAGDSAYFARRGYYITDGAGQRVNPANITSDQLRSGRYSVRQTSGAGNALGRIIFRFPNRFSVYLHDTSSPGAFNNAQRTVSHGCIRLQRPFEIAEFVLPEASQETLDSMRISMDLQPKSEWGKEYIRRNGGRRLISNKRISPVVPVVIDYYTLYPNPKTGIIEKWGDPYGYDKIILKAIKPFLP